MLKDVALHSTIVDVHQLKYSVLAPFLNNKKNPGCTWETSAIKYGGQCKDSVSLGFYVRVDATQNGKTDLKVSRDTFLWYVKVMPLQKTKDKRA